MDRLAAQTPVTSVIVSLDVVQSEFDFLLRQVLFQCDLLDLDGYQFRQFVSVVVPLHDVVLDLCPHDLNSDEGVNENTLGLNRRNNVIKIALGFHDVLQV